MPQPPSPIHVPPPPEDTAADMAGLAGRFLDLWQRNLALWAEQWPAMPPVVPPTENTP